MDKKAKNILVRTYWSGNGWVDRKDRRISDADFAYAKEQGVMFSPVTLTHDQSISAIKEILPKVAQDAVARAFLSSLSTRRLEWRSALASFVCAQRLSPPHEYAPKVSGHGYTNGVITHTSYRCGVCDGSREYEEVDLNVLNFERIKWGGVRLGGRIYTLFDLQQFLREEISEPTRADIDILKSMLSVIAQSQPGDHPSALRDNLAPVIKSSKSERDVLMEILACVDILRPSSCDRPSRGRHDWHFMEHWRGEDKYNEAAVKQYFGKYLD
ncbi:hypothetical protein BLA6993_03179 [Burkholderia lata]|uniref:hypothetical protein n=1 Tax=Burkholderia lata (strain ATCC 17760 / DSM 23089 / LMG 22485 / NCIMB 9086 / R18194 / 383) TaxID=482957 RepID=UPI00145458F1|nr:hypothetical protein [Burkholderia lata]VWB67823.1 hypothetical protein BLA6993_03179 [Burkholderia lata]